MAVEYLTLAQARRWIAGEVRQFAVLVREGLTEDEAAVVLHVGPATADLYGDLLRQVLTDAVADVNPAPGGLETIRARAGERPETALHRARTALGETAKALGIWRKGPRHPSRLGHEGAGREALARMDAAARDVTAARETLAAEIAAAPDGAGAANNNHEGTTS